MNRSAHLLLLSLLAAAAPLHAQTAAPPPAPAPRPAPALTARIEQLTRGFRGEVGVYVRHLGTGAEVAIGADSAFVRAGARGARQFA